MTHDDTARRHAPALAIDLGGTELRVGIVDRAGAILAERQVRTAATAGPAAVVRQMLAVCAEVRAVAGVGPLAGCGIAAPGPLDLDRGLSLAPPTLHGWSDVPLRDMLRDGLDLPVWLENDANAGALGELRFGAGRGLRHLVYVTVSTGIGGGVIIDGRILHGRRGLAAEIGHMTIRANSPRCSCGNSGCWEALASGTALDRRAAEIVASGAPTLMTALAGGAPATARTVLEAAQAGDDAALGLLDDEAALLGEGIANLLHLYAPEIVVVGGGVSACLPLMQARLNAVVRARAMPPYRDVTVTGAGLGRHAGLIGAASVVFSAQCGNVPS